ncbi:MAG: SAM-dependent methlyltransferase [Crocinitomicaceae bacterium]|jgi:SAM-dependent methyltransferase|nr:SAM-dependent methlyltransferase [Crocinitomicaceae bacterium]
MDREFWEQRYSDQQTGWDIGSVSTPVKAYTDQLMDKNLNILIPGCGYGHEAKYLHEQGFTNVYVLDFAEQALAAFRELCPGFPADHILQEDFFTHSGSYDLIIEQTLFCAIDREMRDAYVEQVHRLLKPGGKLVGLLFDCEFNPGPPYGGTREEYEKRFSAQFEELKIENCYNSIPQREGRELFIRLQKEA